MKNIRKSLHPSRKAASCSSHGMEFAKNVADKVLFMSEGVIEEMGTADEVFNNPRSERTKAFFANFGERQ